MRNYGTLVILLIFPILLYSQDTIYRSDQTTTSAQILEWDNSTIEYVTWGTIDSNRHILSTQFIDSIRFQKGQIHHFNKVNNSKALTQKSYPRNYLGIGLLDPIIYSNLRFIYERRFGSGALGLYIPLTIGIKENSIDREYGYDISEKNLNLRIGLGINFHVPRKQGNSLYVIGIGMYGGKIDEIKYDNFEPYELHFESRAFYTFSNSHSLRFHINDWLIIAPGVDINIFGTSHRGNKAFFEPYFWGFKVDILFNLIPKS